MLRILITLLLALLLEKGFTPSGHTAYTPPVTPVIWHPGPVLDQGSLAACVATAWVGWLRAYPYPTGSPTYASIYQAGQDLDAQYDLAGPTIRSGERVLRQLGLLHEVTYTDSVADASRFLASRGPIIVASMWYEGMENPQGDVAQVTGPILGHHSYLCYGVDGPDWLCVNSYGPNWGGRGHFRITAHSLQGTPWFEVALPIKRPPPLFKLLPAN